MAAAQQAGEHKRLGRGCRWPPWWVVGRPPKAKKKGVPGGVVAVLKKNHVRNTNFAAAGGGGVFSGRFRSASTPSYTIKQLNN